MDELKKLIEENRPILDSAEPSEGHFDKFNEMLMKSNNDISDDKKIRNISWPNMLKVAAIAIMVVLSGLYITEHFIVNDDPIANNNSDFQEAQQYYIQLVDQKLNQIEETNMSEDQKKLLLDEMTQMDELYKKLQVDYKAMPNDPRIVQALLQHYQMKMDILNRIVKNLNNVQQLNTPNHANIEI
ncbi:MAG: hypothetical protein JEZ03_17245 [Bacteroidales bacterium]|nr:hypothetical protein [Bacteroidales bacterium]